MKVKALQHRRRKRQTLPVNKTGQAMARTPRRPQGIGVKIVEALRDKNETPAELAVLFDVTAQAVHGWIATGRIGKDKLPLLASHFGRPLSWWLDGDDEAMLSKEERELLDIYRALDQPLQAKVRADAKLLRDLQRAPASPIPKPKK